MSGYALWTRIAIGVLVIGAPLVFLWFLGDAARLLRGLGSASESESEPGSEPGSVADRSPDSR